MALTNTVMELAVLLAAGLDDWVDFGVIIGILCLNAAVGWYQEKQAADVVASLKGDIALRAQVIRDSAQQECLARELVPGDVVSPSFFSNLYQLLIISIGHHRRRPGCTRRLQSNL